ncbi:MAG: TolC family protein, partial [Planctomycetes bacterium]|nr:TolC family protein [Planctomycetota bacterium]
LASIALLPLGCAIRPAGEQSERDRSRELGRAFEEHALPPTLPADPTADDYLRVAFLSNADLQARYWEWRSAIEQIPQDSSFPNVAVPFSVLFNSENMKAWDRTTLGITNDPMTNIPFPTKVAAAGRRALEEARAVGLRFEAAKFRLQAQVLTTYDDLALLAESLRIQRDNVALLRQVVGQAGVRVQTGGASPQDLLKAQTEMDFAENDLANLQAQVPAVVAKMNAILNRPSDASVPLPPSLPAPRSLDVRDDELLRIGSERSPELGALAREVAGREEAVTLAKQAYFPDFSLSFSFMGSVAQTVGGMLILPTRLEAIRAGIEQANSNLRVSQSARSQYERDLAASFVLNLYVLRNDERQVRLFEESILPRARQTVQLGQTAYAANRVSFVELLDSQRTLLDARLTLAKLRTEREKAIAAIETWSAVDVEVMRPSGMTARASAMGSARSAARAMKTNSSSTMGNDR